MSACILNDAGVGCWRTHSPHNAAHIWRRRDARGTSTALEWAAVNSTKKKIPKAGNMGLHFFKKMFTSLFRNFIYIKSMKYFPRSVMRISSILQVESQNVVRWQQVAPIQVSMVFSVFWIFFHMKNVSSSSNVNGVKQVNRRSRSKWWFYNSSVGLDCWSSAEVCWI